MAEEQKVQYFDAKYLDPKYPIVKADPTVDDVIKGMRGSDYLFFSSVVAGTYAYGFLLGKPVRGPTAVMCASAGFTFAMFHTMQTVRSRFLGYRENDREVQKYDVLNFLLWGFLNVVLEQDAWGIVDFLDDPRGFEVWRKSYET